MSKLISLETAIEISHTLKTNGKTIVFTNGCFDLIHSGHVIYLEAAKQLGDVLILGLNSDQSIRLNKGDKRPIMPEFDRVTILSAFWFIDYIVVFDEKAPLQLISALQPHIHVKGGDYQAETLLEYPIIHQYGGQIKILPFVEGKSTTNIIEKIKGL